MKSSRTGDLLLVVFFTGIFIQNATLSIGGVQIGYILLPVGLFMIAGYTNLISLIQSSYFQWYFVFFFYALLRMFTSPHFGEAVVQMVYFGLDFIVMFACYTFVMYAIRNNRQRLVIGSINAVMLATILIYVYIFTTYDLNTLGQNTNVLHSDNMRLTGGFWNSMNYVITENRILRLNGFYLDPNYWALYTFAGLFLIAVMKLSVKNREATTLWSYASYIPPLISCLLTFSRGAILGLLLLMFSILFYLLLSNPKRGIKVLFYSALGFSLLLGLVLFTFFDIELLNQLLLEKTVNDINDTEVSRPFIWTTYLLTFINWPVTKLLFGVGMNRLFYEDVGFFISPHNFIFQLISLLGVIGMALHLAMTGFLIRLLLRARVRFRENAWLFFVSLLFFGAFLVMSLFLDTIFHFPYWIISGTIMGLIRYHELWPERDELRRKNDLLLT